MLMRFEVMAIIAASCEPTSPLLQSVKLGISWKHYDANDDSKPTRILCSSIPNILAFQGKVLVLHYQHKPSRALISPANLFTLFIQGQSVWQTITGQ